MKALVHDALAAALACVDEGATTGARHRNRSKNFVECLADELRGRYSDRVDVAVFSKHYGGNRQQHGLNELMYDVAVCETRQVPSASGRAELTYVSAMLVAIESEMARDSREALYDFSKIVMGRAEANLFIGPHVANEAAYLDALGPAADCCAGETFVALVPHPDEWRPDRESEVSLWQRDTGSWVPA
jgi:hypothetical protein